MPSKLHLLDAVGDVTLYHNPAKYGFASILYSHGGTKHQRSYRLGHLLEAVACLPKDRDSWISQCEFSKPNRRTVNLVRMACCFVDLDCYKMGLEPARVLDSMLHALETDHFPLPSVVNFSGRGLQARWLIHSVPRAALPRWNAVQRELVAMLSGYGADRAASDASRVLRIVDSLNSKSGSRVKTVHVTHDAEGMPMRYGFDFLCEHFLKKTREQLDDDERTKRNEIDHPYSDEQKARMVAARLRREAGQVRPKSGKSKSAISGLPGSQLAWNRLEDLRTLFALREGKLTGHSMSFLFWSLNFLLLAGVVPSSQIFGEAAAICREYGFGQFHRHSELATLVARAKEHELGRKAAFSGEEYTPLYTPRNDTLIDIFGITSDEQQSLLTIIGADEKKRRDTERKRLARQAAGALSRDEYVKKNDHKIPMARLLAERGKSQREIAADLNMALGWVNKALRGCTDT